VSPVCEKHGSHVTFRLKESVQFFLVTGEFSERPTSGRSRMYHKRPTYSIAIICPKVGVVPVVAILISEGKPIGKVSSRWYRELRSTSIYKCSLWISDHGSYLRDSWYSIHVRCSSLKDTYQALHQQGLPKERPLVVVADHSLTVPMTRGFNSELIANEHLENVSFINLNQRARLLIVDEIHLAGEPICGPVS